MLKFKEQSSFCRLESCPIESGRAEMCVSTPELGQLVVLDTHRQYILMVPQLSSSRLDSCSIGSGRAIICVSTPMLRQLQ
jgi:hypothetical protein